MGNGPKAWILLRAFSSRADPSPPRRGRQGCFCQNNRLVCRSERILTRYSSDDLSTGNLCSPFLQKSEGRQSVGREESLFLKNITAARAPFPVHPGGRGGRSPASSQRAGRPVLAPALRVQAAAQPQRDGCQPLGAGPGEPQPALLCSPLGGSAGAPPAASAGRRRRSRTAVGSGEGASGTAPPFQARGRGTPSRLRTRSDARDPYPLRRDELRARSGTGRPLRSPLSISGFVHAFPEHPFRTSVALGESVRR